MSTLTVKIPPSVDAALAQASVLEHMSKSELVRRAVTAYLGPCGAARNARLGTRSNRRSGGLFRWRAG